MLRWPDRADGRCPRRNHIPLPLRKLSTTPSIKIKTSWAAVMADQLCRFGFLKIPFQECQM